MRDPGGLDHQQVAVEVAADSRGVGVGVSGDDLDDLVAMGVEDLHGFHQGLGAPGEQLSRHLMADLHFFRVLVRHQGEQATRPFVLLDRLPPGEVARGGEEAVGVGLRPFEDGLVHGQSIDLDPAEPPVRLELREQPVAPEAAEPGDVLADPGRGRGRVRLGAVARVEEHEQAPGARHGDRIGHRRHPCAVELARLARVPGAHPEQ